MIEHLEWARGIAAAVARRLPTWFTAEDLMGPAEIGLIQAADRFNAAKNDSFRGYAYRRVHGECIACIRRREYRERAHLSLNAPARKEPGSAEELRARDMPVAPNQEAHIRQAEMARVWRYVAELPAAHAQVLGWCYREGLTLVEISARMGVSESWACRLHRQGLAMLRDVCRHLQTAA